MSNKFRKHQKLNLLITARKYEVSDLIDVCLIKINEKINPANAMIVLDYSLGKVVEGAFESGINENNPQTTTNGFKIEKKLETSALEVISHNTKEVLDSEAFLHAADGSVAAVLRLWEVTVREVDVFQAVSLLHIAKK
jgi:hypothetical protein